MRLTKWPIGMALVVLALAVGFGSGLAADKTIRVFVWFHELDVPARLENGHVVAPIRPVAEALRANVYWRPGENSIHIEPTENVVDPSHPVVYVSSEGYTVWCDLPPQSVKTTAQQAVAVARNADRRSFPVRRVILTWVGREAQYSNGGRGGGPLNCPVWLVFFKIPPGEYFHARGPGPVPYGQDGWRVWRGQLHAKYVRVDAQTGKADSLSEGGRPFPPLEPYGPVIQRVFRSIPPEEYETFWNFPRFDGTFYPAQASADEPQRYSTGLSPDGDKYRVSLTHRLGNEQTIWTFLVSKDGEVEREPVVKKTY